MSAEDRSAGEKWDRIELIVSVKNSENRDGSSSRSQPDGRGDALFLPSKSIIRVVKEFLAGFAGDYFGRVIGWFCFFTKLLSPSVHSFLCQQPVLMWPIASLPVDDDALASKTDPWHLWARELISVDGSYFGKEELVCQDLTEFAVVLVVRDRRERGGRVRKVLFKS